MFVFEGVRSVFRYKFQRIEAEASKFAWSESLEFCLGEKIIRDVASGSIDDFRYV